MAHEDRWSSMDDFINDLGVVNDFRNEGIEIEINQDIVYNESSDDADYYEEEMAGASRGVRGVLPVDTPTIPKIDHRAMDEITASLRKANVVLETDTFPVKRDVKPKQLESQSSSQSKKSIERLKEPGPSGFWSRPVVADSWTPQEPEEEFKVQSSDFPALK